MNYNNTIIQFANQYNIGQRQAYNAFKSLGFQRHGENLMYTPYIEQLQKLILLLDVGFFEPEITLIDFSQIPKEHISLFSDNIFKCNKIGYTMDIRDYIKIYNLTHNNSFDKDFLEFASLKFIPKLKSPDEKLKDLYRNINFLDYI